MWKHFVEVFFGICLFTSVNSSVNSNDSALTLITDFNDALRNLNINKTPKSEIVENAECELQWLEILSSADSKYFKVFDSWGKIPSGIAWGHLMNLGNYDECITSEYTLTSGTFKGQYCMAEKPIDDLKVMQRSNYKVISSEDRVNSVNIKIGVCVPAVCSASQTATLLNATVDPKSCSVKNGVQFEVIDYVAITIFATFGLIMICSTLYEFAKNLNDSKPRPLFIAFSLITNSRKLFKISTVKSPNSIDCLNGLRVFSMFWVVYAHTYLWNLVLPLTNFLQVQDWFKEPYSMLVMTGTVSVDTFFFISGFLIAWLGFKELERSKGRLDVWSMYIHRYIRLTPAVAAAILFVVSLYKFMGSGPVWNTFLSIHKNFCDENWWSTLLYVQNYVNPSRMCLGHSWYLAVDTQLYVIAPIILLGLWKFGKKFAPVMIVLSLLSIGCIIATFYSQGLNQVLGLSQGKRMKLTYVPTHTRYSSWLVGVGFGYFMFITRDKKVIMPKWLVVVGWTLCFTVIFSIIFGPLHTTQAGYTKSILEAALYESLSRVSWSIAIGWIVYACHTGYGGPINSLLSYSFWQPFCRINYCMYIAHFIVQTVALGNTKVDVHFSNFNAIQQFWAMFGLTVCVAIIMVLAFESPIIALEKIIFKPKLKPKTLSKEKITENA